MDVPKKPTTNEFGLTNYEAERVRRYWFPPVSSYEEPPEDAARVVRWLRPNSFFFLGAACGVAPSAVVLVKESGWVSLIFPGIVLLPIIAVLGALTGMIAVALVVRPAYMLAASHFVNGFRAYWRLVDETNAYQTKMREFDQWRLRTGVAFWKSLSGVAFEREFAALHKRLGFDVTLTPGSSDGGVDVVLRRGNEVTAVQCKAYRGKVGIAVGRELVTAAKDLGADRMMIACTSGVSPPLYAYAKEKGIQIVTAEDLVKMQAALQGMPVQNITLESPADISARLRVLKRAREQRSI